MKTNSIPNPLTISLKVVGIAAFLMLAAAGAFAKEPPSAMTEFSKNIATVVEYPDFLKGEKTNQVIFAEIVAVCDTNGILTVLDVKSESQNLNIYIKEKLNGQAVKSDPSLVGRELHFKLKFTLV
jgi:hypothetical protein